MKRKYIFNLHPIVLLLGLLLLALTAYVVYRWQISDRHLIPISAGAILAGVFFESRRLSDKWSTVFYTALGAFAFGLLILLPFKNERGYEMENHIELLPYAFLFWFVTFSMFFHEHKVIPKLTEGITLMQSIAVVYWVIDLHIYETAGTFQMVLMAIGLLFALFTVFNAFTHFALTELSRLILSIWSSIIMVLFAADCIYRVYSNGEIEAANTMNTGLYIALQYFLLGVTSIYMGHNLYMLLGFLPGKGRTWGDIADLLEKHVKRYSDSQVKIFHSFLCVALTGTVFYLNHRFQLLPRHLAVWTVFIVFPLILTLLDYVEEQTSR